MKYTECKPKISTLFIEFRRYLAIFAFKMGFLFGFLPITNTYSLILHSCSSRKIKADGPEPRLPSWQSCL